MEQFRPDSGEAFTASGSTSYPGQHEDYVPMDDEFGKRRLNVSRAPAWTRDAVDSFRERRRIEFRASQIVPRMKILSKSEVWADLAAITSSSVSSVKSRFRKHRKPHPAILPDGDIRRTGRKRKLSQEGLDAAASMSDYEKLVERRSPPRTTEAKKRRMSPSQIPQVAMDIRPLTIDDSATTSLAKPSQEVEVKAFKTREGVRNELCFCKRDVQDVCMVHCNGCEGWFHLPCLGLDEKQVRDSPHFFCHECINQAREEQRGLFPVLKSMPLAVQM